MRGGLNLYAYVKNPVSWVDPLGLAGCSVTRDKANKLLNSCV
nr:hypothetical protein [Dickeya sp. ws52]